MIERIAGRLRAVARILGRVSLAAQVVLVGAGVSVPANAADQDRQQRRSVERQQRQSLHSSHGERGHVRRRSDVIERRGHVEKRQGWRRIDQDPNTEARRRGKSARE